MNVCVCVCFVSTIWSLVIKDVTPFEMKWKQKSNFEAMFVEKS